MNVSVTPLVLPNGFCPASYQDMLNNFCSASQVTIPDALSQIVWQTTSPTDQTVSWGKIDSLGRPLGIFRFAQGAWLMPHPTVPGLTMWWFSTLPDFTSFDGGDGNSLSAISGPMWQQALDGNGNQIAASFPIVAGTLPSGKVLPVIGTANVGGEENHLLTSAEGAENPNHQHVSGRMQASGNGTGYFFNEPTSNTNAGAAGIVGASSGTASIVDVSNLTGPFIRTGIVDPTPVPVVSHNNIPPYVVGYLLQRTSRLFIVG